MFKKKVLRIVPLFLVITVAFWFIMVFRQGISVNTEYEIKEDRAGQTDAMHQRINFIRDQCRSYTNTAYWRSSNATPTGSLYTYGGITYCKTPKVGCTHWLRILRFLAKDFKDKDKEITKPSDIDRVQVHYGEYKNIIVSSMNDQLGSFMLSNTHSFMFTRHPFTRLWSAYIDKLFLPDFWRTAAVHVAKTMRQNYTGCVSDITFEEFVKYIVKIPPKRLNEHWKPVHLICSPCHVDFDAIGKQETFVSDSTFIMDTFGLHLEEGKSNKNNRNKGEIEMLVKNYLGLVNTKNQDCYDPLEIMRRLWQAFKLNGYIHKNLAFPLELLSKRKFHKNTTDVFLRVIFGTIDSQNSDMKTQLKDQKRELMKLEFKSLPRDLIRQLIAVYKYDFELFQYSVDI